MLTKKDFENNKIQELKTMNDEKNITDIESDESSEEESEESEEE